MQQQKRRRVFRPGLSVKDGESIYLYRAIRSRLFHGTFLSLGVGWQLKYCEHHKDYPRHTRNLQKSRLRGRTNRKADWSHTGKMRRAGSARSNACPLMIRGTSLYREHHRKTEISCDRFISDPLLTRSFVFFLQSGSPLPPLLSSRNRCRSFLPLLRLGLDDKVFAQAISLTSLTVRCRKVWIVPPKCFRDAF